MHIHHDHVGHGHDHHHHDHDHDHHHHHDHDHAPMEELVALMKYMAGHNAAHTKELADLAQQLHNAGSHSAYEKVLAAVADFQKGNELLSAALAELGE